MLTTLADLDGKRLVTVGGPLDQRTGQLNRVVAVVI